VVDHLRPNVLGWKAYFRPAQTPKVWREPNQRLRDRLRAIQLKQWKGGTTMYRELLALGAKRDVARQAVCRGSDPKGRPRCRLSVVRGDQSLCNGLKLGRPRMALPPDLFDFYSSFTHHFHSLFRMTSEPAWYRRISQADFISH
jgi:hypothetical protein